MHYSTLKTAAVFNDSSQGNALAKRIDDSAVRIVALFSSARFPKLQLKPDDLREEISKVQLKPLLSNTTLLLATAGQATPFTPMAEDGDIFGMLNELTSSLDKLKGFTDLGVYHSSRVTRDFKSTNADNFLNTFKGIATEVANVGAAAATGGAAPTVDVSSIVNAITDSLATAMNHSEDNLAKNEAGKLIASRKGPNGLEYIGIKYEYEYVLKEWTSCGTDNKDGHYSVEKTFFVSYDLAQFRRLYAQAFPDEKDYVISIYFGDRVLEGAGPVLTDDLVDVKIIKALGNTVTGDITSMPTMSNAVFAQRKAKVSIRESGVQALLNSEFKSMTLKKDSPSGVTDYYSMTIRLTHAA